MKVLFTPLTPFIKYLLGTILVAYKDFEDRFSIVEEKMPAIDMVKKATLNKIWKVYETGYQRTMPGTQHKLYRGGIEKTGKGRRIKKGRLGEGDILCSVEMMSLLKYITRESDLIRQIYFTTKRISLVILSGFCVWLLLWNRTQAELKWRSPTASSNWRK